MEKKSLILGLILGLTIGLIATATVYFLVIPTRDKPIPPRVDFITTDLNTCTVDYVRSRFCQEIMTCGYEEYPSILSEYWCTCHT